MRNLLMTTLLCSAATFAQADDAALLLGVERYDDFGSVRDAADVTQARDALIAGGFTVLSAENPDSDTLHRLAADFASEVPDAQRLVVALSGRFATDGNRTWFLAQDSSDPGLFDVERDAISVETVIGLLGRVPGQAVLALGYDDGDTGPLDLNLRMGIGELTGPQGVTILRGDADKIATLMQDSLAQPGGNVVADVRRVRGVTVSGFAPDSLVLVQGTQVASPEAAIENAPRRSSIPEPVAGTDTEGRIWSTALAMNTQAGYVAYIDRFPEGQFIGEAVAKLQELRRNPVSPEQATENELKLGLEARRAVQRSLNVLEYDTRGIDGIFGPGTRGAIGGWQVANDLPRTTYLTAAQIAQIELQATTRNRMLEAQAAQQRAAQDQRDRAYWQETGAQGGSNRLRSYLERYPDGVFADQANQQLAKIEANKRTAAQAEDRAAWDKALERDSPRAFRRYISEFPKGAFVAEAEALIASRSQADAQAPARRAAAKTEAELGLDGIGFRLVEARLAQMGLEPGEVDGTLDGDTRRALRRYQRDRNLDVTGFLNQATVSRLLADGFQ